MEDEESVEGGSAVKAESSLEADEAETVEDEYGHFY